MNEKDLEALRKIQKAEVNMSNLKTAYQQITSMQFEYKSQIEHREQQIKDLINQVEMLTR